MTTVQNAASTPQTAANPVAQSSGAGSPTVTGTPSPNSQTHAPRSYAHATKSSVSGPVANGSSAPLVVGGSGPAVAAAPAQNGKRDSVSARQQQPSSSNNMAAPAIVNSSAAANGGSGVSEHVRKPSVTISAAGASGQMPNGAPQTPSGARPNLTFGSMTASGSPAIADSTPYSAPQQQSSHQQAPQQSQGSQQNSNLPAPPHDPRITSPAASPTPIPQPATSGGRPPSIASQPNGVNGVNFGSLTGGPGPETSHSPQLTGTPQQQPHQGIMPGQPPAHFRRASSQGHGDYSTGMPMGRGGAGAGGSGYMGRQGRGGFQQQGYAGPMPSSPRFSAMQPQYGHASGPRAVPAHFHNQMGPHPGSPHGGPPRSPAPMGSNPGTPHNQPIQMHGQGMYPAYGGYSAQLGAPPGQYNMQPGFDPNYSYYQQPYQMHPNYIPGAPSSPRNPQQYRTQPPPSHHQQPPYGQGQYGGPPANNMSRSSSQMSVSERPGSALSSQHAPAPHSSTPSNSHSSHNHSQSTSAAANANFKIPTRTNKSIVIKNADGEVVNFDSKKTSPAPPPSQSPAPSNPTPPPRTSSTSSHRHSRSDSQSGKSTAEIRAEFQEKVKREQEKEPGIKEEDSPIVVKSDDTVKPEQEPAIAKSELATAPAEKASELAKPVVDDAAVDVPQPTEGSKADELKTEKQDASVESAPAKVDASPEKPVTDVKSGETDEERKKREDDEEMERMIAEMEAKEREEEERERAFQEKREKEKAEQAAKDKAAKENEDERLKAAEKEAEALEEAREAERAAEKAKTEEKTDDQKAEDDKLFASLRKAPPPSGAESEAPIPSPSTAPSTPAEDGKEGFAPRSARPSGSKQKPAALKLETAKMVEPAQPTPGMRSLRSARILNLKAEAVNYPEGISSPNPALNQSGRRGGKVYDKDFLMQFQEAFKEKPSMDWDQKLKETLGDPSDSSVPKSARTPGPRQASHGGHRPAPQPSMAPTPMGSFTGPAGRTLPAGTTSAERFAASQTGRPMNANALASRFGNQQPFPMGQGMPGRAPSMGNMPNYAQMPHRGASKQGSKGARQPSVKEQAEMNKKMPLTAGGDLKPLEASQSGWKPTSVGRPGMPGTTPDGYLPPDLVQRKVKSNLNKLTPERFERISGEILKIAAQSQSETDGRTLRQVIALLFEKACDEAHWASMYARFANRMLHEMSPEIKDENIVDRNQQPVIGGNLFRKYLLNRCQEEFERGWEVNLPMNAEGQQGEAAMMSDEYYKAAAAKRKGLGLVQFIGELYKLGMLSAKIMHTCVKKLLDFEGEPDEASVESLTKLLRTVGQKLEEDAGAQMMTAYFQRIDQIMNTKDLPSRMYFMLLDVRDLRSGGWSSKDDSKGPKTITEIREQAAADQQIKEQERLKEKQRGGTGGRMPSGRGDARNFSGGPMPPPDYNRNTLATDDLRKLSARKAERQASNAPGRSLGPASMMGSRSSSGRGLGPSTLMSRTGSSAGSSPSGSGLHSRSASMAKLDKKDDEPKTNVNAFSALASMESEGPDPTPQSSPPVNKSQPATNASSSSSNANANTSKQPDDKPSS
ncbi:MAG: hypothetical protein Q9162_001800 [Coniocarpon cinnabarinum]